MNMTMGTSNKQEPKDQQDLPKKIELRPNLDQNPMDDKILTLPGLTTSGHKLTGTNPEPLKGSVPVRRWTRASAIFRPCFCSWDFSLLSSLLVEGDQATHPLLVPPICVAKI